MAVLALGALTFSVCCCGCQHGHLAARVLALDALHGALEDGASVADRRHRLPRRLHTPRPAAQHRGTDRLAR